MNIKALIGIVVLVVLVGGGWWIYTANPGAIGFSQVLPASELTEETDYTSIWVKYPEGPQAVRAIIESSLAQDIADFKENTTGLDATVLPSLADGHKLNLIAEYYTYEGSGTVSYWYTIFVDTGGAHPNTYFKTFVFDQNGSQLSLGDVLASNPQWLEELSLLVSQEVTAQVADRLQSDLPQGEEGPDVTGAVFVEGLAPKLENFQNWFIDGTSLVIEIPPYQVAAYALGSFEVRVPLAEIDK